MAVGAGGAGGMSIIEEGEGVMRMLRWGLQGRLVFFFFFGMQ